MSARRRLRRARNGRPLRPEQSRDPLGGLEVHRVAAGRPPVRADGLAHAPLLLERLPHDQVELRPLGEPLEDLRRDLLELLPVLPAELDLEPPHGDPRLEGVLSSRLLEVVVRRRQGAPLEQRVHGGHERRRIVLREGRLEGRVGIGGSDVERHAIRVPRQAAALAFDGERGPLLHRRPSGAREEEACRGRRGGGSRLPHPGLSGTLRPGVGTGYGGAVSEEASPTSPRYRPQGKFLPGHAVDLQSEWRRTRSDEMPYRAISHRVSWTRESY